MTSMNLQDRSLLRIEKLRQQRRMQGSLLRGQAGGARLPRRISRDQLPRIACKITGLCRPDSRLQPTHSQDGYELVASCHRALTKNLRATGS